jgi:FkbM family methyltransferase
MRDPGTAELLLERDHLRLRACRHGPMLYNARDIYIGGSLDAYGEFSEGEVALFAQILRPGMLAVDVGANIGAHTLPMAQLVGPTGRVVAYEPQRVVFQNLCANVALSGMENVIAHWAAATRLPGAVRVPLLDYAAGGNFGGTSLGGPGAAEMVAGVPIDALDLSACHLIKVDVEGMEEEVLAGAARTITRHRPILYVENDRPSGSHALLARILRMGYRAWWHLPPLFSPDNYAGAVENRFPGIVSVNVLALPAESGTPVNGMTEITDPGATAPGLVLA